MKAVIVLCIVSTFVAVTVAQNDAMTRMMMMNFLRNQGGSGRGAGGASGGAGGAGGNPLAALFGGGMGRGLGMFALSGAMNDRTRDMLMCNYMTQQPNMRQLCMMSAMA